MRVVVAADENGRELSEVVKEHLRALGHDVRDPVHGLDPAADYPDVAELAVGEIVNGLAVRAILVCGTGLGMAIAANKVPGIRAGSVTDPYSAERLVKSNDAQVMCLGARVIGPEVAKVLVDHFMGSTFQGGESTRKVEKIEAMEHRRSSVVSPEGRSLVEVGLQPDGIRAPEEEQLDEPK
ncbi:RpiB/LacA/LacB family sugar-phosphate isomerase [soil metagenome]